MYNSAGFCTILRVAKSYIFKICTILRVLYLKTPQFCNRTKSYPGSSIKNSETKMNKYFLWAVAIAALCSSCETEDETFATETKKQTIALQQAKSAEANDYQTYQSILNSFVYNQDETYAENLLRFEQHVNQRIPYADETTPYKPLDLKQVAFLATADAAYIEHLNYSATAKTMMYAVLNQRYNDETAKNTLE